MSNVDNIGRVSATQGLVGLAGQVESTLDEDPSDSMGYNRWKHVLVQDISKRHKHLEAAALQSA